MRLVNLSLSNFRNYETADLEFGDFNVFVGPNAQGKTNLLEAILFLATTKSHRASGDDELIRQGSEFSHVSGAVEDTWTQRRIEIANRLHTRKQVKLDGKTLVRLSSLVGLLKVVFFAPESNAVVRGGPGDRRHFLDVMISQVRREYLRSLQRYQTALRQRNEALKQGRHGGQAGALLDIWDAPVIESGADLMRLRQDTCDSLGPILQRRHAYLADDGENAELHYMPNVPILTDEDQQRDEFEARLVAALDGDHARGTTSVGPHRDDLLFTIDGTDARRFASQGQQRTLTLALKLAEFDWIRNVADELPVFLLDDVTSELDVARAKLLYDALGSVPTQVFLTTTEMDPGLVAGRDGARVWHVRAGTLHEEEYVVP